MSKKGGGSAPSPDPQIGEAALKQAQTGESWLTFAKDAYALSQDRQADLDALTKRVTEMQLSTAEQARQYATEDRQRYQDKFVPLQDEFIKKAQEYDTPERRAEAAASARADVQSNAAMQKAAADRQSAALGIRPDSGRRAGIDRATELGTTLGITGAENAARKQVETTGLGLTADAINIGSGLPAQSASNAALGLDGGSNAVGLNQNTNQQFLNSTGIVNNGFSGAMTGYSGQASTLGNLYNSQVNAWSAQQQADAQGISGLFSGLGTAAGLLFKSDENVKTDKRPMADGEAMAALEKMPVEKWRYKEGIADKGEHAGTYAQDFQRETGLGDGKNISAIDAIGITMGAVKDVNKKVDRIADAIGLGQQPAPAKPRPRKRPANDAQPTRRTPSTPQTAAQPGNQPIGLGVA